MIIFPNAKINIGLNIIARRTDGYHNLETIFYPIKIHDALEIITADELHFQASGLGIPGRVEDNLCLKGYHLIKKDHDVPLVNIHLHKHIPIGAGLGGGSADAAFFIKLLDRHFQLQLSLEEQITYARQLGADCAFFIENKPVFAYDKGDKFESVSLELSKYSIALVMPPAHVSTSEAFRGIKPAPVSRSLKELITLPVEEWKNYIRNDFEQSIFRSQPLIRGVKADLYASGAIYAAMSGSGASVFGIFENTPDLSRLEKTNQVFYNV